MKPKSALFVLVITILTIILFSSCSERSDKNFTVTIIDSFKVFPPNFKEKIANANFHFPVGIPVLVITTDSIPIPKLGEFAKDQLDYSSKWIKSKTDRNNCLLIVISQRPRLLQLRFGENLRLEAYKAGIAIGSKYRQYQEIYLSKNNSDGLVTVLDSLQRELPADLELSWITRQEKPEVKTVFNGLSDLAAPSENDYTKFVFKPYNKLITSSKLFSHPIILVILNSLILFLLVKIGHILVIFLLGKKKLGLVAMNIWSYVAGIFFMIPYWGSIIFLSSFRIEDTLYAQNLGIKIFDLKAYSFFLNSYTPFWLALIIAVVTFFIEFQRFYFSFIGIKWLLDSNNTPINSIELDPDESTDVLGKAFWRAVAVVFLALFVPIAISLLILFYTVIKIPSAILGYKGMMKESYA